MSPRPLYQYYYCSTFTLRIGLLYLGLTYTMNLQQMVKRGSYPQGKPAGKTIKKDARGVHLPFGEIPLNPNSSEVLRRALS